MPSIGRHVKWKLVGSYFVPKNDGRSHTIVYNECPILHFLRFVLYFVAAP